MTAKLEIACFNLESALVAHQSGADRIELCDGFDVGGTTPSVQNVNALKAASDVDLYVMIRPRGGDFVYTQQELEQMRKEIIQFKELKVDGFVFGILNEDNSIDTLRNTELVELAHPIPCTFHRAFDKVSDAFLALEQVIGCGFQTILTSGQASNVTDGVDRLAELVIKANNRIAIMPGGGLRSTNIASVQQKTRAKWYHSSAITSGSIANPNEIEALQSNLIPSQ